MSKKRGILKRDCETFTGRAYPELVLSEGAGLYVKDVDGNEYMDLTCASCILGHRHPKIISAVKAQLEKLDHIYANWVLPGEIFLKNAELIKSIVPGKLKNGKVVYFGSGTEAVSFAKRLAKSATGKQAIIAHIGAHHGQLLDVTADVSSLKKGYAPCIVDCFHIPFPYCYRCVIGHKYPDCNMACLNYLEAALDTILPTENIGAMLVEPLQSWNGFITPPDEYFPRLKRLCEENDILLIDDEVITGFGRTGKMFAIEHWNIEPDIIILGKAIGMGFSGNSAIVAPTEMIDNWSNSWGGIVGSPGGSLPACAASVSGIEVIKENNLISKAAKLGRNLHKLLQEMASRYNSIGRVNGMGLMASIDIVDDNVRKRPSPTKATEIVNSAFRKGLLLEKGVGTYKNVIRFIPPLIITDEEINKAMEILDKSLQDVK